MLCSSPAYLVMPHAVPHLSPLCLPACSIISVNVRGWPYLFVVTTRDVEAGQELLYSYGGGYCEWRVLGRLDEGTICCL